MDRVSQLRGQGSSNRSSYSDTSQSSNDLNETLDSTKYFTCDEGSTLSISPSNVGLPDSDLSDNISEFPNNIDATLTETSTLENKNVFYETPGIETGLSPITRKRSSIDCFKLGDQIDAANILSGNVEIFDDNDNSYGENDLVIDDNAPIHEDKVAGDNELKTDELKNKDLKIINQEIPGLKDINPVNYDSQPLATVSQCALQKATSISEARNLSNVVPPTNNEDLTMIKEIAYHKNETQSQITDSNPQEQKHTLESSLPSENVQTDIDSQIMYGSCATRQSETMKKTERYDEMMLLEKGSMREIINRPQSELAEGGFSVPSTMEINPSAEVSSNLYKTKDNVSMYQNPNRLNLTMAQESSINILPVNMPTEKLTVKKNNSGNSPLENTMTDIVPSGGLSNDLDGPINDSSFVNINMLNQTDNSNIVLESSKSISELHSSSTDTSLAINLKCNAGKTHTSKLDTLPPTENPVNNVVNLIPTMSVATENLPSISSSNNNVGSLIPKELVVSDTLGSPESSNLCKTMVSTTNSLNQTDDKGLQSGCINPEEVSENIANLEVISENLESSENFESSDNQELEGLQENIMENEEESPAQSANEVVLQIDGKPVDAIDIGNGLYLYRTDNDKLNAIQVLEDDGQPEFKFLKVRYNAEGNLEVYEEIIETSGQEKDPIDNRLNDESRTPSEVSIISANRRFFDQPSTSKSGLSLLDTQKGNDSKDSKINKSPGSTIKIKEKLNKNRTSGLVESRKSPFTYQTGSNKDTVPLTKSMVDQKLQGMSSDSSRKTIELSTTESCKKSNEIKDFESSKEPQCLSSQEALINEKPKKQINLHGMAKLNAEDTLQIKNFEFHKMEDRIENTVDKENEFKLENKLHDVIEQKTKLLGVIKENTNEKIQEQTEKLQENIKTKLEDKIEFKMQEKIEEKTNDLLDEKIEEQREETIENKTNESLDKKMEVKMEKKIEETIREKIKERLEDKIEADVEGKIVQNNDKIKEKLENPLGEKCESHIENKMEDKFEDIIKNKKTDKIEEKTESSKDEIKTKLDDKVDMLEEIKNKDNENNIITANKSRDEKINKDDIKPPVELTKEIGTTSISCSYNANTKDPTENFSQLCDKMKKENTSLLNRPTSEINIKPEFYSSALAGEDAIEIDEDNRVLLKDKTDETLPVKSQFLISTELSENQNTEKQNLPVAQTTTALNLAKGSSTHISTSPSVVEAFSQPFISNKTCALKNEKESIEHIAALAMTALSETKQNLQMTKVHSPSLTHHALPQTDFRHKSGLSALTTEPRAPFLKTLPTVPKQEISFKETLGQSELIKPNKIEMNACKHSPESNVEIMSQTKSNIGELTQPVTNFSSETLTPKPQELLKEDLKKTVEFPKVETKLLKANSNKILASNQYKYIKQDESQTSKLIQMHLPQGHGSRTPKPENMQKVDVVGSGAQEDGANNRILENNFGPNSPLEGIVKNIDPAGQTETKPVPFGKWTEANKQAYLNKLKDSKTNISLQNSNVIKLPSPNNKNDLNSREFIKKTEIKRDAATVASGSATNSKLPLPLSKSNPKECKTEPKISVIKNISESVHPVKQCYSPEPLVSPETLMLSTNSSVIAADNMKLASNSILSQSKPSTSKTISASEMNMSTTSNFTVTKRTLVAAKDVKIIETKVSLDGQKAPIVKGSVVTESKIPSVGCAVKVSTPKPYVPPKQIQSDATQKQNDSKTKDFNYQSLIDKTIEDMINSQPKPMNHYPERSGNPTQSLVPQNVPSNNHSNVGINPNYPNMQKATPISEDMYKVPGQYTVIPSETIISQKPYTAPNKPNEVVQKQYPGSYAHPRTYRNLSSMSQKNTSQKISNVALLQDKQLLLPSKTSSSQQSLLEDMEKKMNELHGIPFVETPRMQLDSLSTNANKSENAKASVSTKTNKIPNLLPLPNKKIPQTITTERDDDSEDEIFECEPVTGDSDNRWASSNYNQSLNLQQSTSRSPLKKNETVFQPKYKSNSGTKEEPNKITHRKSNQLSINTNFEKPATQNASISEKNSSRPNKNISTTESIKQGGDLQIIPVKPNNPELKYYSSMATDAQKYQSKVQMAYQTAITAKQQKEPPVTILEDKAVKVVYLDNGLEVSNQQQTVTKHSASAQSISKDIVEMSASTKGSQDLKNEGVQHKPYHQRKQVFAPDLTNIVDLIEPQELEELSPSNVRTEDIEKKNPKNIMAKKDYLLGRASLPKEDIKLTELINVSSQDKLAPKLDTLHNMPPKKDENKNDEIKKDEDKKDENKKDGNKKDENKKDENKKDEYNKDEEVSLSLPILRSNIRASIESSQKNIEITKPKYKGISYKLKEKPNLPAECSQRQKEKNENLKIQDSSAELVEKVDCLLDTPKRKRGRPRKNPNAELPEKSSEKPNITLNEKSTYKQSAKSPKKPKLSLSPVSEDSESNEDEEMVKENWTMGKINENIVCPICNKLFRSENVVFKHVKHCSGSSRSPTRSADSGDQDGIQKSAMSITRSRSNSFDSQDLALLRGETSSNIPENKSHQVSETIVIDDSPAVNEAKIVKLKQEMLTPLSRLRKIMNVHGRAYNYTCELCGKNFRQLSYFNTHKSLHCKELNKKNVKSNVRDALTCETCGKEFRQLHHLVQHRETQHICNIPKPNRKSSTDQAGIKSTKDENVAGFRCEPCDKSFRKLHHLVEHRETHDGVNRSKASQIVNVDSKQGSPQCEVCGKIFRKLHHLIEHREQHNESASKETQVNTGKKPGFLAKDIIHECSLCYMVFPNEHSLARHYGICQRKKKQAKQKALQVLEEQKANDISATKEDEVIISCKTSMRTEMNKPLSEIRNEPEKKHAREAVDAALAECAVKNDIVTETVDDQDIQNYKFGETIHRDTDALQTQASVKGSVTKIKEIMQKHNTIESKVASRTYSKDSTTSDNSDVPLKSKARIKSLATKSILKTSIKPEITKGKQLNSSVKRRSEDSISENSDVPLKIISVEKSLDAKRLSKDSVISDNSDAPLKPLQNLDSNKQRSSKRLSKESVTEVADIPSKSKKMHVKPMATPKRKISHPDKFATVTKRKRRSANVKMVDDSLANKAVTVDDSEDEIRYMINPEFVVSTDEEEKEIFMKIRTIKRNSLNLDKPKKVIRRKSLQDPIGLIKSRRKSSGKQIASSSKDLKPESNSFRAKEGKLDLDSDDGDDAEIKYSFPTKELQEDKNITAPKKSVDSKRKSLTGIAKKKSLGTLAKVSFCQNKVTANAKHASESKRRTTMVEHRCDCGQLFSSSALLARHTTVAHTPPRVRRNRLTLVDTQKSNTNIKNETKTIKK